MMKGLKITFTALFLILAILAIPITKTFKGQKIHLNFVRNIKNKDQETIRKTYSAINHWLDVIATSTDSALGNEDSMAEEEYKEIVNSDFLWVPTFESNLNFDPEIRAESTYAFFQTNEDGHVFVSPK